MNTDDFNFEEMMRAAQSGNASWFTGGAHGVTRPTEPTPAQLMRQYLWEITQSASAAGAKAQIKRMGGHSAMRYAVEFRHGPRIFGSEWCHTLKAAFTEAALKWNGDL